MRVDRRLLGWGVFFILVGVIPLATRAGYLDSRVVGTWPSLWPILLIAWGIGLVLRRTRIEWLGGALAAVTLGLMGGGLLATGLAGAPISTGCGDVGGGTAFPTQTGAFGTSGRLNVELNCGSVALQAVDGSGWTVAGTETDGRAPRVRTDGSTVTIDDPERTAFFDRGRTDWTVSVPRSPELGLGLTINAGSGTLDLDGATLSTVDATVNAGSARIDLGGAARLGDLNATVNAGSAVVLLPSGGRSVSMSLNAGSLDVCLAPATPVRVTWGGALGSNDFDEAGLTKVDNNTWESPGLNILAPFLELRVSANAGSFGLDTDGTCNA